jgi:phospho-N-acetylmuramoyl-pentapeptide-transferase
MLGTIAVATKHEIVLGIIGGLFVAEALSVMIQVGWFKRTGKRVFLMAPSTTTSRSSAGRSHRRRYRFWIVSLMLARSASPPEAAVAR